MVVLSDCETIQFIFCFSIVHWLVYLLTRKASPIIFSRQQVKFRRLFENNKYVMIFHENRLLADDSYEISYLIFF